jgi:hypothetical protein
MHSDEYEISLFRELAVCMAAIKKLERHLACLPEIDQPEGDASPSAVAAGRGMRPGLDELTEQLQALQIWTERKKQYETMLAVMKISSPS